MPTQKRHNRVTEIITSFFHNKYGKSIGQRFSDYFNHWIVDSRDAQEKESALHQIWDEIDLEPNRWSHRSLKKFKQKRDHAQIAVSPRRVAMMVAAVMIPAAILVGGWLYYNDQEVNTNTNIMTAQVSRIEVNVPKAKIENVVMADGTQITVNSGSKIAYQQDIDNATQRVVQLEGESYFDVARNEQKPFVVQTKELTIRVLGTKFNVEAYPERDLTIVTLNSGEVVIKTANDQQYTLRPNQQLIYTNSTANTEIIDLSGTKTDEISEWKTGNLVLINNTVGEILKSIERHYNIDIVSNDDLVQGKRYSAKFDNDAPLDHVMSVLKAIIPGFEYRIENNQLIIMKETK